MEDESIKNQRNRNMAFVLIAAGVFIVLEHQFGFFTVCALLLIGLGIHKVRTYSEKSGYIFLAIGVIFLLSDHFAIIVSIILISLGYFFIKSKQVHQDGAYLQKQNIIESIKWDKEPWVMRNMSLWNVIGEIRMDMSMAIMEEKETTLILQGVVGDVDIIVPEDLGISVHALLQVGQLDVAKENERGVLNKIVWQSANYETSDRRVKLMLSYMVGDIDIKVL